MMSNLSMILTSSGFVAATVVMVLSLRRNLSSRKKVLTLGSRSSDLAMVQTHWVKAEIERRNPTVRVLIRKGVDALGDLVLDQPLKKLAAQTPGLFTKELELGVLHGMYDAVVHSLKDMPTQLPAGLILAGITEREDPRDAVVLHLKYRKRLPKGSTDFLRLLPKGAIVGTSSVRREAFLKRDYPHLVIKLIRGNVNTRLAKLDNGEYDAVILAMAGLVRLGPYFESRIDQVLNPEVFGYGVSQGSLGLQCRKGDQETIALLESIAHEDSSDRCKAERSLLRTLEGGCQVPLGVATEVKHLPDGRRTLKLTCTILSASGRVSLSGSIRGAAEGAEALGEELAHRLMKRGGKALMGEHHTSGPVRPLTYGSAAEPHVSARQAEEQ